MFEEEWNFIQNASDLLPVIPTQSPNSQPANANHNNDYYVQRPSCMYAQYEGVQNDSLSQNSPANNWNNFQGVPSTSFMPQIQGATMQNPQSNGSYKMKRKRVRTAFTTDQTNILERRFQKRPYISSDERKLLNEKLNVGDKVIKVWFQNRRLKEKRIKEEQIAEAQSAAMFFNNFTDDTNPNINLNVDSNNTNGFNFPLYICNNSSNNDTTSNHNLHVNNMHALNNAISIPNNESTAVFQPLSPPTSNEDNNLVEDDPLHSILNAVITLEDFM